MVVLGIVLGATAHASERPAEFVHLPEPIHLARLTIPDTPGRPPLVIVVPDALGEDGRSEPYVDSLLARGIASLVLGLGGDLDARPAPVDPAVSPAAVAVALTWAAESGFEVNRTGLLGFGLGGRAALIADPDTPVAALYPGCTGLMPPKHSRALVLQGGYEARDCDALSDNDRIMVQVLQGAGHAWDAPGSLWPSPGPVLPDPAGTGLIRARVSLEATLVAAEAVADWFTSLLLASEQSAAR